MTPIEMATQVVESKTAAEFDGVLLDLFTASAIVAVHDGLQRESNRIMLSQMSLPQAAKVCLALAGRARR